MIDELHELRKTNPHEPDDLAGAVAMSRDDLVLALRTDSSRFPWAVGLLARWPLPTVSARISWVGALAAIVLAVVALGQLVSSGDDTDVDMAEIPTTLPVERPEAPTTTAIVDAVATTALESLSTTAPPTTATPTTDVPTTEMPTTAVPTTAMPTTDPPSTTTPSTTAPPSTAPSQPTIDGPFVRGDLLVVHFDFGHTDDGLSALADRELAEWYGLDPLVVAGTAQPGVFSHDYGELMNSGWGSGWVDAKANRSTAVDLAVNEWLGVLDAGGDVWIAEGGVSDFSAEVLRRVRTDRPSLNTASRIHIVQHAQRNEDETTPVDFVYVQANADYIRIDDGNTGNDTADLFAPSSEFEAAALDGPRSAAWSVGFDLHSGGLDFSDTVAVLHILGVGIDGIANPTDFAGLFM